MKFSEFLNNNKALKLDEAGGEIDAAIAGVAGLMLKTLMEIKKLTINLLKWKIYYSQEKRAENQKEIGLAKIAALKSQKGDEFKKKYNEQTSNMAQQMPPEKRKIFRSAREENYQNAKDEFDSKYENMKTEFEKKAQVQIDKYSDKAKEVNTPDSKLAQGIWAEKQGNLKAEIDRKFADQLVGVLKQIKLNGGMDPEDVEAFVARQNKLIEEELAAAKERIQKAKERIQREKERLNDRIENASDDEKEAALKIKDFQQSLQDFVAAVEKANSFLNENYSSEYDLLNKNYFPSYLNESDDDDDEGVSAEKQEEFKKAKSEAREAGKKMNRALAAITKGVLKKGLKLSDEEAEAWLDTIKSEKDDLIDELKATKFDVEDDVEVDIKDEKPSQSDDSTENKPEEEKPAEKEPEKETEPSRDKEEYTKEKLKEKLKKAEIALEKAKEEGASEEKIKGIESQIEKKKKELEEIGESAESFNYSRINEELDLLIKEINNLTNNSKKVFTFEQFLKSR